MKRQSIVSAARAMFSVMLICSGSYSYAAEWEQRPTIFWYLTDWSPWTIKKGRFKGEGIFDELFKLYVENLPEYEHVLRYASGKRIFREIKDKPNAFSIGWLKTPERQQDALYSLVHTISPTIKIVTSKEKFDLFNSFLGANNTISLRILLEKQGELRVGVTEKRSYTSHLDPIIRMHLNQGNIYKYVTGDLGSGFIRILQQDQIDYFIEYPHVVTYKIKEHSLDFTPHFLQIDEIDNFYVYGYTIGSKSTFAQEVMKKINAIIKKEVASLIEFGEKWYDQESIQMIRDKNLYQILFNQQEEK